MEPGIVLVLVIATAIVSVVAGMLIMRVVIKRYQETQGVVYAYYPDKESKPSLLLEPNVPIEDIAARKRVHFDVIVIQ